MIVAVGSGVSVTAIVATSARDVETGSVASGFRYFGWNSSEGNASTSVGGSVGRENWYLQQRSSVATDASTVGSIVKLQFYYGREFDWYLRRSTFRLEDGFGWQRSLFSGLG